MNMRKIIAVLSAALLLCAAIPMSALSVAAAPGDVIIDADFNDGMDGFNNFSVADGALVLDGTSDDWANSYAYAGSIQANTEYTVTLRVKADAAKKLDIKINNGWTGGTQSKAGIAVTTEWQEFTVTLDGCPALDQGAIFTIQTPTYKNEGTVYYIDYVKVVEKPREPGKIVNGDFEAGFNGWNALQGTVIGEGRNGQGANLKGNGGWGGMLNQTIPVEAGKTYKISVWAKANANGANIQILDGDTNGAVVESKWFTTAEWTELTWEVVPTADCICINFCGGGNDIAEDVLVDDVTIAAKEYGKVINGDFETGDETGWNVNGASIVDGGYNSEYAVSLNNPGVWSEALTQVIDVEANTTYKITWMSKRLSGEGAFNLVVSQSVSPWGQFTHIEGQNWMNETSGEWVANSYTVNSGDNTAMLLKFTTEAENPGAILLDNIVVRKVIPASDDGFIKNGDFETGEGTPWTIYSGEVNATAAKNGNYGLHITHASGNWNGTAYQDFTVEIGKTYVVTMDAKAITQGQNIQIQDGGTVVKSASKWFTTTEWTQLTFEFTATTTSARINICGGGTNSPEEIYVDNVRVEEKAAVQAAIVNGDFETGDSSSWTSLWGSTALEIVEGRNGGSALKGTASGAWNITYQEVTVNPNTKYTVQAYAKDADQAALWIKNAGGEGDITSKNFAAGSDWSMTSVTFDSGANTSVWVGLMGLAAGGTYTVDDIVILEGEVKEPPHELYNGGFETGDLTHWSDEWGSGIASIVDGYESGYAMQITNAGQWAHIRQDNIAIKPNTDYRLSAVVKNAQNMAFVVKNGGDNYNLITEKQGGAFPAGEDWQQFSMVFNTGVDEYGNAITIDSICILVIAYEAGGSVIIDNIVLEEVVPCEHEYFYACDAHCMHCGELTNPDAAHSIVHVEAKAPGNCVEFGNKEYWTCEHCGGAWLDETLRIQTNSKAVMIAGNCVSDAEFPCQDGICTGCGLPYAADEEHTYDNEYDADCNICGDVREVEAPPVEIIYGDANGDGVVDLTDASLIQQYLAGYDVTVETSADANGDGVVDLTDASLIQQYLAGYDVTLGPVA